VPNDQVSTEAGQLQSDLAESSSDRRVARLTALIGVVAADLELICILLISRIPGGTARDAEIKRFYERFGHRLSTLVGLYIMPFAGIALIQFVVLLRMWIRVDADRKNNMESIIQLASGILYIAILFVSAAAMSVFAATAQFTDTEVDPNLARQFPSFAHTQLLVSGMRMAAMFVITSSALGLRSELMPKRSAYLGFGIFLFLLLSISLHPWFAVVFPVWTLLSCGHIFRRARNLSVG